MKSDKNFWSSAKNFAHLIWVGASILTQIVSLIFLIQALIYSANGSLFLSMMPWIYFIFFFVLVIVANLKSLYSQNFLWSQTPKLLLINAILPLNTFLMIVIIAWEVLLLRKQKKTQPNV